MPRRRAKLGLLPSLLLALLNLVVACSSGSIQGPSRDFSSYKPVRPRVFHGRSKRELSSTRESATDHADVLTVGLEIDGRDRILDLRLNSDLVAAGYIERHQHQGSYKTHLPPKTDLCQYQGSIRDVPGSWAAVSTCHGLKGVIFDGESLHHIQPEDESLQALHYLYNHADLVANNTCGYTGSPHHIANEFMALNKARGISRNKRAAESIRGPYNANRDSRFVELVLVIDKSEYDIMGKNLTRVHHRCKDIANIINAIYTPLNIFIALVGVEVWTDADEILLLSDGDATLRNFLQYRRERLVKSIPNDNAQLLTRVQFDLGVVGKALKGPICTYEFSGGVSVDHSNVVGLVAATIAHEMGHNFGMEHDGSECVCPEEKCIMAPSSGSSSPTHWSSCSIEYLALAFEHGMDYCLRNRPRRLFDSPICGNGFVEPGEQCDCGLVNDCENPCCDAATCMLHSNASCATGECCDLTRCKPKIAGTECRGANQECDLPEYCTGQSEYCPQDVFKIDGETCSEGKAYCYQGQCRTHSDQCRLLWGPTGMSSDPQCYEQNNKGLKTGNCGYNRTSNSFIRCDNENILCGLLHCKHLNERLEFGIESVSSQSHSFINSNGRIIACRSAMVDLGLDQVDPGLAPDGAKCAAGKMCVNQKCTPVARLRTLFPGGNACPNNCSGNGVCNSLGHCHCNRGFQPPDCTEPGVGGSEDSGPAEDPNARRQYIMFLYITFLGIVPTIGLTAFAVWYARNNGGVAGTSGMKQTWKKATKSSAASNTISTLSRGFGYQQHRPAPGSRSINGGTGVKLGTPGSGIDTIDSSLAAVVTPNAYHQQQQRDPASASLLPKGSSSSSDPDERFNNNLFGQFKGFSISPLQREAIRPAPSVPTGLVAIKTNPQQRAPVGNGTLPRRQRPSSPEAAPPALPPPNAGSTARPLISSPVLAATTCTSLELGAGQQQPEVVVVPSRSAPAPPASLMPPPPPPSSHPETNSTSSTTTTSTLNRIASMLSPISGMVRSATNSPSYSGTANTANQERQERRVHPNYSSHSLPRSSQHKASKIADRELLRSLEISNPIPQREIELASPTIPVGPQAQSLDDEAGSKSKLPMRAQSMRAGKTTSRPTIHTFGSMRSPKRPASLAASACRPSSPPPPVPPSQSPPQQQYDDCMNLTKISEESPTIPAPAAPSIDNIYAVIEEPLPQKLRVTRAAPAPPAVYKTPRPLGSQPKQVPTVATAAVPGTDSSLGLLSEIVSEISSRNEESIYSSKSLSPELPAYANAPGVYSNSSETSGSHANSPDLVSSCSSRLRRPGATGALATTAKSPDVLAGGRTAPTVPSAKPVAPPKSSLVAAMQLKFERNDEA